MHPNAPHLATGTHPRSRRTKKEHRELPHNSDAEQSILGGILLRNEVLAELDTLEIDAFYDHRNKVVFQAVRALESASRPIDVVSLEAEIEKQGKLDAIGGIAYLGELGARVPTPDNVREYARIVRDLHLLREVAQRAGRALEQALDWEYEPDELLAETVVALQNLDRTYREANERLPIITVSHALDELERLAATPIYELPFPEVNRALGFDGILGGQVYYLTGGTGFGKTSFLSRVVRHHAEQRRPSLIAFWEMFAGYYIARMVAPVMGVHANSIVRGRARREAIEQAMPPGVEFLDSPSMSILRRAAERVVKLAGQPPLIVADYIQLLADRIMATMVRPDARLANSQASAGLRELAKETGSPVIAVSAAGRSASKDLAKDVRKRPARDLISSSRESGAIEFDGAGVIVLSVSDEKDGDEDIATISIAKARFGETRHIDARYNGRTGEWREVGIVAVVQKAPAAKPDDGRVRGIVMEIFREHKRGALVKHPLLSTRSNDNLRKALEKRKPLTKNQVNVAARETSRGASKEAINSEIDALTEAGILVTEGAGWELSEDASEVVLEAQQLDLGGSAS